MVFCTCAEANQAAYLDKIDVWYQYIHKYVDADFYVINDGVLFPSNRSRDLGDLTFVEFPMVAGRQSIIAFPGWKRSFAAALKISKKYKYFGHIENDCFVKDITEFNNRLHRDKLVTTGWNVNHNFVEFTAAIINDPEVRNTLQVFYSDTNNQRRPENFEDQVLPMLKGWIPLLGQSIRLEQGGQDNLDYDIVAQCPLDKFRKMVQHYTNTSKHLLYNHSGKMGDFFYSLNFAKEYAESKGLDKFSINFQLGQYDGRDVRLTKETVDWMRPLLEYQPYIDRITTSDRPPEFCFNLDAFRWCGVNTSAQDIRYWYYRYKSNYLPKDFYTPILTAPKDERFSDNIVITLTPRHRNKNINYTKLRALADRVLFVGRKEEYDAFVQQNFQCQHYQVKNALELATLLNSAKLFIGNQNGIFAIAEQLKVPRVLETAEHHPLSAPNVLPMGGKCCELLRSPGLDL